MKNKSALRTILASMTIIIAIHNVSANNVVDIVRHGRRVEPDGFLLEWDPRVSRQWGDTEWRWDAINTADGVAGYFTATAARPCTAWTFAVNTKISSSSITVPNQMKNEYFAFDRGSFENDGYYTIEWVVPWTFFENNAGAETKTDANAYVMTLIGENVCGESLPAITIAARRGEMSAAPANNIQLYGIMAIIAIATLIITTVRRKARVKKSKNKFDAKES